MALVHFFTALVHFYIAYVHFFTALAHFYGARVHFYGAHVHFFMNGVRGLYLISKGANKYVKDEDGKTPYDYANKDEIKELLS